MPVAPSQRWSAARHCPICQGYPALPAGKGVRCWGYLSSDGDYAHCTNDSMGGDLSPGKDESYPHRLAGDCRCGVVHSAGVEAPRPILLKLGRRLLHETAYQIGDFVHLRREYDDGEKGFSWMRADGRSGLGTFPLSDVPLYGAERLPPEPAGTVIVCEGEKATDALLAHGFIAVGSATGAKSAPSAGVLSVLKGFDVVLWPDNDPIDKHGVYLGQHHMEMIAGTLYEIGIANRTLEWAGAPLKGDAFDFFSAGNTEAEAQALIDAAPSSKKSVTAAPTTVERGVRIWSADELTAEVFTAPKWAIPGILPAGLTIVAGRPKLGKSWMALGWAINLSGDSPVFRSVQSLSGDTLYLALEDGPRRIQERLAMMLGDAKPPKQMHIATEWPRINEGGEEMLDEWLEEHDETRLVVIDTFKRVRPIEKHTARLYDNDYDAIVPVAKLAQERNVAIVCVFHTRKGESTDPLEMVSGTLGLTGAADCVMVLRRERGQADASLFITGRDVEEQDLALKWETADEFGWRLLGDAENFRRSIERQKIVDVLAQVPGMSPTEIAAALGKTAGSVRYLLFAMVQDGDVRNRDGKYYPGLAATNLLVPSKSPNTTNAANTPSSPTPLHPASAVVEAVAAPVSGVRAVSGVSDNSDVRADCRVCGGPVLIGKFLCMDCESAAQRQREAVEASRIGMEVK